MDSSDGPKRRSKWWISNFIPKLFLNVETLSHLRIVWVGILAQISEILQIISLMRFAAGLKFLNMTGRSENQVNLKTLNLILTKLSLSFKFLLFLFFVVSIILEVLVFEPYQDILSSFLSIWQYLIISFD